MLTTENLLGKSGVPVHETWDVHDSSKLKQYILCPRRYFYKYILGWNSSKANVNLVFGSAIHAAMEVLALQGHSPASVHDAYEAFMTVWSEHYDTGPFSEPPSRTKNSDRAFELLPEYAAVYRKDDPEYTRYVEIAGNVPIRDDRLFYFKLDTLREREPWHPNAGRLYSREHKTTGKTYLKVWEESWSYDFQIAAYNYVVYCLLDHDKSWQRDADGVEVNGIITWPKNNKFERIVVKKSPVQLEAWLNQANHLIDQLENEIAILADTSPRDRTLFSFQPKGNNCAHTFSGCAFHPYCSLHANPLQHIDRVPMDCKVDFWDPRRREETAKKVVHLEPRLEG